MDDARLSNGMTLDDIGQRLVAIDKKVTSLQVDMSAVKSTVGSLQSNVGSLQSNVGSLQSNVGSLQSNVGSLQADAGSLQSTLASLQAEVRSGFKRVDEELNAAKIRDEEAHRLLKFSLEAREGLRESVEARFEEADKKHDDQIDLLKQVVQRLATQQADV
jgi:chromosome segregation ATPase